MNYIGERGNEFKFGAYVLTLTRESFATLNMDNFHDMVIADYNRMWSVVEDVLSSTITF